MYLLVSSVYFFLRKRKEDHLLILRREMGMLGDEEER